MWVPILLVVIVIILALGHRDSGGILSDTEILRAIETGDIVIEPFHEKSLGGNSYDVHLGRTLLVYKPMTWEPVPGRVVQAIDAKAEPSTIEIDIPSEGFLLRPGELYLASTVEYTETHAHVPYLDGKSSTGRLGIGIHLTAGRGDVGFCNHWTMEIFVIEPVVVYPGMPIGQLTFHTVKGRVQRVYTTKVGSSYGTLDRNPKPQPSRLWTKFQKGA